MALFGKQYRFCPNCGKKLYDMGVSTTHVLSMMCSAECRGEWQTKYAAKVLGIDAELPPRPDEELTTWEEMFPRGPGSHE